MSEQLKEIEEQEIQQQEEIEEADLTITKNDEDQLKGKRFGVIRLRKELKRFSKETKRPIIIDIQDPIFGRILNALNGEKGVYGANTDGIAQFDDRVPERIPQSRYDKQEKWFVRIRCYGPRVKKSLW